MNSELAIKKKPKANRNLLSLKIFRLNLSPGVLSPFFLGRLLLKELLDIGDAKLL